MNNTFAICSTCYKKIPAGISQDSTGVYLHKHCCSEEKVLIERSADFYNWVSGLSYNNIMGKYLSIPITTRCNTTCKACYNKDLGTELSVEEIRGLAFSAPTSINRYIFTGGEPTYHSKFLDALAAVPNTGLITNGLLFQDSEFLKETLKHTSIDIPGVLPWMFSLNTKDTPDYENKLKALDNIKALGFKVSIIVATVFSLDEIPTVINEFKKLKDVGHTFKIRAAFNIGEYNQADRIFLSDLVQTALCSVESGEFIPGLNNHQYLLNFNLDGLHTILVVCPDKTTIDLLNIGPCGPYQYTKLGYIDNLMAALIADEGLLKGWVGGNKLEGV